MPSSRVDMRTLPLWVCVLGLLLGACSSGDPVTDDRPRGSGEFAASCQKTEDCASGLCVRLTNDQGICTKSCDDKQDCPAADNWGCLDSEQKLKVCACRPLGEREVCADGIDNDCDGTVDDCQICGGRAVPFDHHEHCGQCGNACRADQACVEGVCSCPDDLPVDCQGRCTDTSSDDSNCGACGQICPEPQTCTNSACSCPDPAYATYCEGVGCIDLQSDAENCGRCGTVCAEPTTCQQGSCKCPNEAQPDYCAGDGCVDLSSDERNCGVCSTICRVDQVCTDGACVCNPGELECEGRCVRVATSTSNCGACGVRCGVDQYCDDGQCICYWGTLCGSSCFDLRVDPNNCGTCGHACGENESCSAGQCGCPSGVFCGDKCMPANDPLNCGACGKTCAAGQYCNGVSCSCTTYGLSACTTGCFDLNFDAQHCGTCTTQCRAGEVCNYGTCRCPYGQIWCEAAGRCADLQSDEANCGTCGITCKNSQQCLAGTCQCPDYNQQYCTATDRCENIRYDEANCGGCGVTCPASTECNYGTCVCSELGKILCDGVCVAYGSDPNHCGACNKKCNSPQICARGACTCPDPVVGTPVRVTNRPTNDVYPSAAWDGTNVGVAYVSYTASPYTADVRFALLDTTGQVINDVALATYTGPYAGFSYGMRPRLIWSGAEYALVWYTPAESGKVKFLRLSATGALKGTAIDVADPLFSVGSQPPDVAFSSSYGGYAVSYSSSGGLLFRRIGSTGTGSESANSLSVSTHSAMLTRIASAPDGSWAVAAGYGDSVMFVQLNADGSRTAPIRRLSGGTIIPGSTYPDLIHDGRTWVIGTFNYSSVFAYRGNSATSDDLYTRSSPTSDLWSVDLLLDRGVLVAAWTDQAGVLGLRRFVSPENELAHYTALGPIVDVVATPNATAPSVVGTSAGLLAIWADSRWGDAREIYAAPIDVKNCP